MSDVDQRAVERLQAIMTALLERRLAESLAHVADAIGRWRKGGMTVFETHAELLRHAARAERMAERMAQLDLQGASGLMRDAFDVGLLDREEFIEMVGTEPESVEPSPSIEDDAGTGLPKKRAVVEDLLGSGPVLVHVDARRQEVTVPERFRDDEKLVLRFGYGLTPAIIDLSVDDQALSGTLTFSGVPRRCILPWDAVYAVVSEIDHKGMVWPDDVPPSVVDALAKESPATSPEPVPEPVDRPTPTVVASSKDEPGNRRGGHLKLVK